MNTRRLAAGLIVAMLVTSLPAAAADRAKILRVALPRAETGFDPAQANEIYSGAVIAAIMEPLLTFDYLARPYKLVPNTAAALPEVSADGLSWTIRIKPGIYFSDSTRGGCGHSWGAPCS